MELFCREYRYSLDAKNRIFVPAKYREILGDTFIITRRLDTCLALYTNEEWEKYSEKIKALFCFYLYARTTGNCLHHSSCAEDLSCLFVTIFTV